MPLSTNGFAAGVVFFAGLLSTTIGIFSWRRHGYVGNRLFAVMMWASALWVVCDGLAAIAPTFMARVQANQISYFGIVLIPGLYLLFSLRYTGNTYRLSPLQAAAYWVIPVIVLISVLTNPLHHLHWPEITVDPGSGLLRFGRGPTFWLNVVYSYGYTVAGWVVIGRFAALAPPTYRRQVITLIAGALIVLASNVIYLLNLFPIPGLDPSSLSFTLTGGVLAWGLFRYHLLDLVPVARATLFESLDAGVLVVDDRGMIVDVNPAARSLLGVDGLSVGLNLKDLLQAQPLLLAELLNENAAQIELELPGNPPRALDIRVRPLGKDPLMPTGRLMLIQEFTDKKRAADELRTKTAEAQLARQSAENATLELRAALVQLEQFATTDKLTGQYNRYKFDELLTAEVERAKRYNQPLSLVIFDIDHFKQVNDQHGHHAGDQVLAVLARLVRANLRSADSLARWGGEEFTILAPGTNIGQAAQMAEKIRKLVEHYAIPGVQRLTISLGVAAYQPNEAGEELMRRADRALYLAKNNGRNRVEALKAEAASAN